MEYYAMVKKDESKICTDIMSKNQQSAHLRMLHKIISAERYRNIDINIDIAMDMGAHIYPYNLKYE